MELTREQGEVYVPISAALDETGEHATEEQLCVLRVLRGFLLTASAESKTAFMQLVWNRESNTCPADEKAVQMAEQMGRALCAVMKMVSPAA